MTETLIVIPCAAAKLDTPAPARDLYDSANFRHMLAAAEAEAASHQRDMGTPARVMILSAKHGLIDLDTIVAPYDVKMTDRTGTIAPAAVAAQLRDIAPDAVVAMLPATGYAPVLAAAIAEINDDEDGELWISQYDAFEAAPGIGFQRGVASSLIRVADVDLATAAPVVEVAPVVDEYELVAELEADAHAAMMEAVLGADWEAPCAVLAR